MQIIDAAMLHRLADYPGLVAALRTMNHSCVDQIQRFYLSQKRVEGGRNDWLLLPARWHDPSLA